MNSWISVKDKLPEEHITVLVYCPSTLGVPVWVGFYTEGKWYLYDTDTKPTITHWMYIPEFPDSKAKIMEDDNETGN